MHFVNSQLYSIVLRERRQIFVHHLFCIPENNLQKGDHHMVCTTFSLHN